MRNTSKLQQFALAEELATAIAKANVTYRTLPDTADEATKVAHGKVIEAAINAAWNSGLSDSTIFDLLDDVDRIEEELSA